eukprot:gene542-21185_t
MGGRAGGGGVGPGDRAACRSEGPKEWGYGTVTEVARGRAAARADGGGASAP